MADSMKESMAYMKGVLNDSAILEREDGDFFEELKSLREETAKMLSVLEDVHADIMTSGERDEWTDWLEKSAKNIRVYSGVLVGKSEWIKKRVDSIAWGVEEAVKRAEAALADRG